MALDFIQTSIGNLINLKNGVRPFVNGNTIVWQNTQGVAVVEGYADNTTATIQFNTYVTQILNNSSQQTYLQLWDTGKGAYQYLRCVNGELQLATTTGTPGTFSHIPSSDAGTGGSGSAGAGKQYVNLKINGTVYKLLHD